jgi:hypothetical protein
MKPSTIKKSESSPKESSVLGLEKCMFRYSRQFSFKAMQNKLRSSINPTANPILQGEMMCGFSIPLGITVDHFMVCPKVEDFLL